MNILGDYTFDSGEIGFYVVVTDHDVRFDKYGEVESCKFEATVERWVGPEADPVVVVKYEDGIVSGNVPDFDHSWFEDIAEDIANTEFEEQGLRHDYGWRGVSDSDFLPRGRM